MVAATAVAKSKIEAKAIVEINLVVEARQATEANPTEVSRTEAIRIGARSNNVNNSVSNKIIGVANSSKANAANKLIEADKSKAVNSLDVSHNVVDNKLQNQCLRHEINLDFKELERATSQLPASLKKRIKVHVEGKTPVQRRPIN